MKFAWFLGIINIFFFFILPVKIKYKCKLNPVTQNQKYRVLFLVKLVLSFFEIIIKYSELRTMGITLSYILTHL
ncbi:hypothetical protein NMY3_03374 [Candidatus Nitrosocosmicus oleophilus]|uniref:Uncharacterized protein n=1 Tax=Candidatus Nitrosocosmicus oleophilus TaxID=1353260 RepID=A0A654M2X5_9ARCH|nr:hypothetical protein NMY3_03374 [Candidatus Nitrosocosmicus oleophilus]